MDSILLLCGQLFDGKTEALQEGMEVLVRGRTITEVGRNLPRPEGCRIVDLKDAAVTPGMIDAHVHPDGFRVEHVLEETIYASDEWRTLAGLHTAQRALRRGFTTLRIAGAMVARTYGLADVRRAIDCGYFEGSRLNIAFFPLTATGGHGDLTQRLVQNPMLADLYEEACPSIGNGPDFFRKMVRRQIKYGADFIKIMATGGFASPVDAPEEVHMVDAEFEAVMETAHCLRRTVTAHAYAPELIQKLVRMGIDGIEHGALMDAQTAELMEKQGTYLVPTFSPYDDIVHPDEEALRKKSPYFQRKLRQYAPRLQAARDVIRQSNLRLGYGTDFVAVHECYENGYEYSAWLRSGMPPFRALKAATSINAEILGRDDIGVIAPGKLADIAAWKRDLLTDPDALLDCAFVMKDGVVYDTEPVL